MNKITFVITREELYKRIYTTSAHIVRARETMGIPSSICERMLITADEKQTVAPLVDDSVNEVIAEITLYHPGSYVDFTLNEEGGSYNFVLRVPNNFPSGNEEKLSHCIKSYIADRTLQSWYTIIKPDEAAIIATKAQNDAVTMRMLLTQREKPSHKDQHTNNTL